MPVPGAVAGPNSPSKPKAQVEPQPSISRPRRAGAPTLRGSSAVQQGCLWPELYGCVGIFVLGSLVGRHALQLLAALLASDPEMRGNYCMVTVVRPQTEAVSLENVS